MSNTDIYNLRKEIQVLAIEAQNIFYAAPNVGKNKARYLVLGEIYDRIITLNNEAEIKKFMNDLATQSNKYRAIYNSKLEDYNRETDYEKKNAKTRELNEIAARINAYNTAYNIINKYISKKAVQTVVPAQKMKPVEKPKVEQKPVEKPVQKPVVKQQPAPTYTSNNDIEISNKIITLLQKDHESEEETEEYRRQVYELRNLRESKYKTIPNYRILLTELESIENMISISTNNRLNEMNLGREDFVKELRSCLNAINEYYFKDDLQIKKYYRPNSELSDKKNEIMYYKKYNNYVRKFHVLIYSLFNTNSTTFTVNGETISTDDLLAYLSTCNLDGDFKVYSSKFGKDKIGVQEANKKNYIDTLKFLYECIAALSVKVEDKIKDKKVKLVDNEVTRDELIRQRNQKLSEINDIFTRTKGGTYVR